VSLPIQLFEKTQCHEARRLTGTAWKLLSLLAVRMSNNSSKNLVTWWPSSSAHPE